MNRKLIALCAAAVMAFTFVSGLFASNDALSDQKLIPFSATEEENALEFENGLDFAKQLQIGWNLGNTFDAPDGETTWGNPVTTREMLAYVKGLGFQTIRIPISWAKHTGGAPEYKIHDVFMNRIDEVVTDALDAGLNVIINSHHDNDVYSPTPENSAHGQEYLTAIWTQIGDHFKDFDYRLIFQTMNEPRVVGTSYEWSVNTKNDKSMAALGVVNELNQAALNAIRATGGNNADRFVIISPYAGSPSAAMIGAFQLPQDSVEDRLIVSIHSYSPYNFALNKNSADNTFGKAKEGEIRSIIKSLQFYFVRKGIPVIIDEMGCLNKNNSDARYAWGKAFVSTAVEYGIPCVWWDNGAIEGSGENFGLIDRRNLTVYEQSQGVYQGMMEGLDANK